jgi:hypothetical protein
MQEFDRKLKHRKQFGTGKKVPEFDDKFSATAL